MLSRAVLLNLGRQCRNNLMSNRLPTHVFHRIKELGLLKNTRGNRAGYSVRQRLIKSSRKIDSSFRTVAIMQIQDLQDLPEEWSIRFIGI